MKSAELKPFKIGYGDEQIAFYPQMVSDAILDEFAAKFLDISDTDELKHQKLFDIRLEAIAAFSAEPPRRVVKENGEVKYVELVEGEIFTHAAISKYFNKESPASEKVIRAAYNAIVNLMQPEISFL